ncbi:hypothetical protein NE237_021382 [Protea cynaroides]|uniref:C3H1-type domain-containing protein n=1 Tax=Protea cynaroides TaxID=273540 RepID=A0A9Q0K3H1_9MAGN|nr:hypothetical protein NE237_021382 [Protea cynaroides]
MAGTPVYLVSPSGEVTISYPAYKAVEKLRGPVEKLRGLFSWYPSPSVDPVESVYTDATVVHDRVSSTEDVLDHVSYTEDVPDHLSSTEDAPVSVETLEEEFPTVGLEDNNKDNVDEDDDFNEDNIDLDSLVREAKDRTPDDICHNYLVTGTCRNGSNCWYTHPTRKENQAQRSIPPESAQKVIREKEKKNLSEKMEQQECKYFLRSGGCKVRKACRYRHSQEKPVVPPPIDFNFLGLPIRPGQRECTNYMRDGSCQYGPNCRFHHPDPTAVTEGDVPSGSFSLHPSGVSASTSWSSPPNGTVPYPDAANHYVPRMLPPQGVHHNAEWNGYQTTVGPCERECPYYMCAGSCKYGPSCSFRHPDPTSLGRGPANPSVPMVLRPQGVPQNLEWNGNRASFRPNGTQPLPSENCNPLGWNKPKTNPAVNGTSSKGAKNTKIVGSSWCKICMIDFPSKVALDKHIWGKKHKENLEKLKESKKEARAPTAAAAAHAAKHPAVGLKESPVADKGKTVGVQQSKEKGAPSLWPGEDLETLIVKSFWCEICNFDCKSQIVLDQHKLGKQHKKNLEKLEEPKKDASAPTAKDPIVGPKASPADDKGKTQRVQSSWPENCKIDCESKNVLDQPKLGKKHNKNLEKLEKSKKEASAPAAAKAAHAAKHPTVGLKESPAADKGKTIGVQQSKEKGVPSLGPGEDLETLIVKSVWCEICKMDCTSQILLDQHKLGKKHKKNLEKLGESKREASAPAATTAHAANHPVVGLIESPAADNGKTVGVQQNKEKGAPFLGHGGDLDTQVMKLMDGGAAANASWLCVVCNVVFISQTDFNDHLAGQKHADMVKKQEAEAGTSNPSDPLGGFYFIEDELL